MDVLTRSNRARNGQAAASVVVAVLALGVLPAAVAVVRSSHRWHLTAAAYAIPLSTVLSMVSVVLARRARLLTERTLGRVGGERLTQIGRLLGVLALCMSAAAAISIGFYGLAKLYEH